MVSTLVGHTASWGEGDYNDTHNPLELTEDTTITRDKEGNLVITTVQTVLTMTFDVNGRQGGCNRCGQCCSHLISNCVGSPNCKQRTVGNYHCCEHLDVVGIIGEEGATMCKIRDRLLQEGYKSCVSFPSEKYEIANRPACGYRFP